MSSKVTPAANDKYAASNNASGDRFGDALVIKQEFAPIEMCGVEAKNRYRVSKSSKDLNDKSSDGPMVFYVSEESDCCERIMCSVNRSLELLIHQGASKRIRSFCG